MEDEIINNYVYLTDHITNLERILVHLLENKIITQDERELIGNCGTTATKNDKLLSCILKKDWKIIRNNFLEILRLTTNKHCADLIEGIESQSDDFLHPLKKWWPYERNLPKAFQERRCGNKLLVENLNNMISESEYSGTIIKQKVVITGQGGVGKTTTATWYSSYYSKNYAHILWIDCGEGNLLYSMQMLARELSISDITLLKAPDLGREVFSALDTRKCLFIFDNAECYQGKEKGGIREVLPKNPNHHVIITSRNRLWGSENGDGMIPELQLSVFTQQEGVEFLTKALNGQTTEKKQIERLCEVLGYLPLALQIAVATLNRRKITIDEYIERISQTDSIIHTDFDDYDQTINKAMEVSMDIIRKHENDSGATALQILSKSCYLRPNNVEIDFYKTLEKVSQAVIDEATDLLEDYSLATKRVTNQHKTLSVHRLLQTVVRYKEKPKKSETLKQIIGCEGFRNYKWDPCVYTDADEDLRKDYNLLGTRLLVFENEISALGDPRRKEVSSFQIVNIKEACSKSRLAKTYYYSIFLENQGNRKAAIENLLSLYPQVFRMKQEAVPTKGMVAGLLYLFYNKDGNNIEANKFLEIERRLLLPYSDDAWSFMMQSMNLADGYSLYNVFSDSIDFQLEAANFCNEIRLYNDRMPISRPFPSNVQSMAIFNITFLEEKGEPLKRFDLSHIIPPNVTNLHLSHNPQTFLTLPAILWDRLAPIQNININSCEIIVDELKISPKELKLWDIIFMMDGKEETSVVINDIISFDNLQNLKLCCQEFKQNVEIDLIDTIHIDSVYLAYIKLTNWEKSSWDINKLTLWGIPIIEQNKMVVRHLELQFARIELSNLPQTIESLTLGWHIQTSCRNALNFQELSEIELWNNSANCLTHFQNCSNLKRVSMQAHSGENYNFEATDIPESVATFELNQKKGKISMCGKATYALETLILENYSFDEMSNILRRIKPNALIYNTKSGCTVTPEDVIKLRKLIEKPIETIKIGEIAATNPTGMIDFLLSSKNSTASKVEMKNISFTNQDGLILKEFDLSSLIVPNLTKLRIRGSNNTKITIFLHHLVTIHSLHLERCALIISNSDIKMTPKYLEFREIDIRKEGQNVEYILLNDFCDFANIEELRINCGETQNIGLNLSGTIEVSHLSLDNVTTNSPCMKSERDRLKTYYSNPPWPVAFLSPEIVAQEGFYYLNHGDYVQCAFCNILLYNFQEDDDISSDHRKFSPECPIVCESLSNNNITLHELGEMGSLKIRENDQWTISNLRLAGVNLLTTNNLIIKHLAIQDSKVEISVLPNTIETLKLNEGCIITSKAEPRLIFLENLKYLELNGKISSLSLFSNCSRLKSLVVGASSVWDSSLNLNAVPSTVSTLKLVNINSLMGKILHLDRLILSQYPLERIQSALGKIQANQIVILTKQEITAESVPKVLDIIKKPFKTITIGKFNCENGIHDYVERIGNYYAFEGGKGTVLDYTEFQKLMTCEY